MQRYFWELDPEKIHDRCILLDIDGTLVYAGSDHLHPGVYDMIEKLKKNNDIVIFSNGVHKKRNYHVAQKMGLPYARSQWRKPSPLVLRSVPNPNSRPMLIIGDLFITDGLLALTTGSEYIRVKRYVSDRESRLWRLTLYYTDDLIVKVLRLHFRET